jgi:hypothetical protein
MPSEAIVVVVFKITVDGWLRLKISISWVVLGSEEVMERFKVG